MLRPFSETSDEMSSDPDVQRFRQMVRSMKADPTAEFSAQAVKLARQITVHHPNDAEAFFILGEALGMMNLEDEALEACNHSLKLNSEHVGSLVLSANAMLGKRKRDAGLKLITRALSLDPDENAFLDDLRPTASPARARGGS